MKRPSRTTTNFVASLGAYTVSLFIGLIYTPILINDLGVAVYGLIPLAFSLLQYFGFLAQTAGAAVRQRLVLKINDPSAFNSVYSTAVLLVAGLAAFLLIAFFAISGYLANLFNIPVGYEAATRLVFLATAASFVLTLVSIPLQATVFSQDAIYLISLKDALVTVVRVSTVLILFTLVTPSLQQVSLGILLGGVAGALFIFVCAHLLRPSLRFSLRGFDTSLVKGMLSTSGGVLLTQLGTLLLLNTDLFIVNLIYGPTLSGSYAAAAQWAVVLRGLGQSVAISVTAKIMHAYHHDRITLIAVSCRSVRLLTAFAALPAGFIAGVSPSLLSIWVGPELKQAWPILAALAVPSAINLAGLPLLSIALAADRNYGIGICYIISGAIFVGISIVLADQLSFGGVEIATALGAVLILRNWIYVIPKIGRLVGEGATVPFLTSSFWSVLWVAVATLLAALLNLLMHPNTYLELAIIGLMITPPYLAVLAATLPREDTRLVQTEAGVMLAFFRRRTAGQVQITEPRTLKI